MLKYFGYILACILLFLVITGAFPGGQDISPGVPNTATSFEWKKEVSIFVVDRALAETSSCEATARLVRRIPNAETLGPGALQALIMGLSVEEEADYWSAINKDTLIQKFEIIGGVAYVDFSAELNSGIAGSCNVVAIRSQIENTLVALPDINSVILSVDGQIEGILEP